MLAKLIRALISSPAKVRTLLQARQSAAYHFVTYLSKKTSRRERRRRPHVNNTRPLGYAKGTGFKSIIQAFSFHGRDFHLHATKGWRSYRSSGR